MGELPEGLIIPEDAKFEEAPVTPHDAKVKPIDGNALHLEGDSSKGEIVEYVSFDDVDGTFTHEMRQDVEPALKDIRRMELEQGNSIGKNKDKDFYHAARVPQVVLIAWLNKRGLKMSDFKGEIVDNFLNDSANSAFRVWKGRV